ncbi:MAG TPA: PH domain-containing protein [Verrucomicrobiae bacterium]|nr:PH domain-containing protein [Verrucomicrobiae bacterium]
MISLNRLPNAVADEQVVHVLRSHPITLWWLFGGIAFVVLAPLAVWTVLPSVAPELLADQPSQALIMLGGSIFCLFIWLFLFQSFLDYLLDIWIVTNKRILNIEQTGLFSRTVSELRLYRIQDVTSHVNGFIATVFDYGNVEIQTAGEKEHFVFENIPHPTRISKTILDLSELDRKQHLDEAVEEFGMPDTSHTDQK